MATPSILIILFLLILLALSLRRILADASIKGEVERLRLEVQELAELRRLTASLQTELEIERSREGKRDAFLQQTEARLNTAFENLSRTILEERGRALGEENSSRMNQLMQPFREQLESFRQRVDAVHRDDTELAGQLKEQLVQLMNLNAGWVKRRAVLFGQLKAIRKSRVTGGSWS